MIPRRLPVLVVDSDARRRTGLARVASTLGGQVVELGSPNDIDGSPSAGRFELAIVEVADVTAAGGEGLAALARLLRGSDATLICHSAGLLSWPIGARCELLLLGASLLLDTRQSTFDKDVNEEVSRCMQRRRPLAADEGLLETMRDVGIVGQSPPMLRMFQMIARFAPLSELPVLVTGETGTGKEVVVNAIRRLDTKRAHRPFIPVNCAALPKAIAEAELFGHRRGAFSGAESHRLGLVRAADGGTLFLDEIGDLDLELQAKLLRVLQERSVLSVGEDREVPVDVRIMAATHRDLKARSIEGGFREDLYYRLAVLPLHIPPLRQRAEDIPLLVQHFASKYAGLRPRGLPPVAAEFIEALSTANLPGNVRELENIVRSVLARRDHDRALGLGDLPLDVLAEVAQRQQAGTSFTPSEAPPAPGSPSSGPPNSWRASCEPSTETLDAPPSSRARQKLADVLSACERATVESALIVAKGNQVNAARLLGISTRSVYSKMRKHRLDGRIRCSDPTT
jgi:transcriptional regulator with GAF, ATPase, and Fis domain